MLLLQVALEDKSILEIIIGTLTIKEFTAFTIMGYVGLVVSLMQSYLSRSNDGDKPPKFSFKFWWNDNYHRIIPGIFIVPLSIIFMEDWFGNSLSTMTALVAGFSTDSVIEILKKRSILFFNPATEVSTNHDESEVIDSDDEPVADITGNNE
jgi:hypothetical protein